MEEQKTAALPYKVELLKPEENDELKKNFIFNYQFYRVGPKGYIVMHPFLDDAANIYNMPLRPTDVFVASYQRSGTTWTQELVWLLANDLDYSKAAEVPLTQRYPFLDFFMFFDLKNMDEMTKRSSEFDKQNVGKMFSIMGKPLTGAISAMPENAPRFIKTHLPMSLLNPKLLDTAKMVYVARDPRDVAVSCYHHARLFKIIQFDDFKEFWEKFRNNLYTLCPIIEHVKEAWAMRHHPNMLFLFYEELSKHLPASIRRVADFLGKELNQEQMDRLCDHLSIENFKKNPSINFEELRELGMLASDETFIRKGKTGGWRDYFDEEMTRQAEQWIEESLRDTDLRYPNMK